MIYIKFSISISDSDFDSISNINMKTVTEDDKRIIHKIISFDIMKLLSEELSTDIIQYNYIEYNLEFTIKSVNNYSFLSNISTLFEKIVHEEMTRWHLLENPLQEFTIKSV
jgi:hypothetical protein